jgi:serine/threonine protein kinase
MSQPLPAGAELAPGYVVVDHLSRNQALDVYDLFSTERACRCVGKLLRTDRPDERAARRLRREAEILLSLTHPHLVRAYELLPGPPEVLILETLTGSTLARLVDDEGPLWGEQVAELGLHLCSALTYMHRCGWLHLDVKPDNVVAERGVGKLLDLSLARAPGRIPSGVGTRQYLAPEQARGGEVGPAADVWGVGATLFAAATGDHPFASLPRPRERYPQLRLRAPRLADGALLPRGLATLMDACLEPSAGDRPSLAELNGGLALFAEPEPERLAA